MKRKQRKLWAKNNSARLRKNPGRGERELQKQARDRGLRFKVSPPYGLYFPDLMFPDCKLVIEVDGGYHWSQEQRAYDRKKDSWLRGKGWKVVRVWAADAVERPREVFEGAFVQAFGIGHDKF